VILEFSGEIWFWKGPSPFHFVTVPADESELIKSVAPTVTYGWGMIPCEAVIGETRFSTSLWPKDGGYILPIKSAVRKSAGIDLGETIPVTLIVD
jgi:hypothetical protein